MKHDLHCDFHCDFTFTFTSLSLSSSPSLSLYLHSTLQMPITPAYIAIGCNRFSNISSSSSHGLIAFGAGHTVALWHDTRGVYQTLVGHTAEVSCLKFVPRMDAFVSGDEVGAVKVWMRCGEGYEAVHSVQAHTASVSALDVVKTARGVLILSGGSDAVVHVYQWTTDGREAGGTSLPLSLLVRH